MLESLTPSEGKWLVQVGVSEIGTREYTFIIPRGTRKQGHTYQIVSMHGLGDGDGFVESVKPAYASGVDMLLYSLGISTAPIDWVVIDAVPEVEGVMK